MKNSKLLRFIIVGVINTLFGTAIMFGMYNLMGFSYWVSSAANYVLASILSYVLNRRFTFGYEGNTVKSGARFVINIAACYLMAYGAAKPFAVLLLSGSTVAVQENAAMLTGMCIFTGLNYIGQRFFVFREVVMEHMKAYDQWLDSEYISEEEKQELRNMSREEIHEAFYKYAEFGTAGMRGIMGLGTNRLNKYTIRMASKGLAMMLGEGAKVAVAYDTRNNSRQFAGETAGVLAASGLKVLMFDRYSPVPLLSYTIRELGCDGGVVITASHNTSEYNGFKVYDSTGCQMNEDMAGQIAANIKGLEDGLAIESAEADHENITCIGDEVIENFFAAVNECDTGIDRRYAGDLKVVYTSLHGSGREYVLRTLDTAGFRQVTLVKEQAEYDGDFPTVEKPNPEDKAAFKIAEKTAAETGADIIIGTDPDCDRIGVGVVKEDGVEYLSGNQIGILMIDFLARMDKSTKGKKLVTSIVTGDMGKTVAESYGIDVIKTFTGFKNIGAEINKIEKEKFFMGYEESYGYLPGRHVRDKDGVSSSLIVCQMAAYWKAHGKTLTDVLKELYEKHGYWMDEQESFVFEGSEGAERIASIMEKLRSSGDELFADIVKTEDVLDYSTGIDGLRPANVLKYMFDGGSWIAVRPSGTEPKIKFYYCITTSEEDKSAEIYDKLKKRIESLVN